MMKRIAARTMGEGGRAARRLRGAVVLSVAVAVITASVIAAGIIASSFGGSAAADDNPQIKTAVLQPASLAGRWSGSHYGYGRGASSGSCSAEGCKLIYDIVACKEGWCGIAVNNDKTCGAIAVRLAADRKSPEPNTFDGKLELVKGSADYTVKAWFYADKDSGTVQLRFLGDTGPELLLMRRSFPFEADLARTGDAVCTLDKATS
jgi:hypothetical protein